MWSNVGVDCEDGSGGGSFPKPYTSESARVRRKLKDVKVKKDIEGFTIGKYITLQKVEGLVDRAIVEKLEYIRMNRFRN